MTRPVVVVYRHPEHADDIQLYGFDEDPMVVYLDAGSCFDVTSPCRGDVEAVNEWAEIALAEVADLPEGHGARGFVEDVCAQVLAEYADYMTEPK